MTKPIILCVDDEQIPEPCAALFCRKGYEVVPAASGKKLSKSCPRATSTVLIDQLMPGMVGTELTRQIKLVRPDMPVIIISGVNELPPDANLADRFISKIAWPRSPVCRQRSRSPRTSPQQEFSVRHVVPARGLAAGFSPR